MRFRALFIGGPVDGQERALDGCPLVLEAVVVGFTGRTVVRYMRLYAVDTTAIYSLYGIEETMNRVWNRYAGENHA